MKRKASIQINRAYKNLGLQVHCFILLLKNLLLIRMLRVKDVSLLDSIVIEGNEATLFWRVIGCHRIKIEGIGSVKGNASGIKFRMQDIDKSIQVCFYGIARRRTVSLSFNGSKVSLRNKFYSDSGLQKKLGSKYSRTLLKVNFHYQDWKPILITSLVNLIYLTKTNMNL
ncbi:MAG: hypothetical protein IPJ86_14905 [Bacteroidetes bacterium]|nr:hypothetical protein [Bacteroidota bacterium]